MKTKSKTSLFLMELIVVILFFSLSSTVCIQLFVKSHLLGTETKDLNQGVLQLQNMAEVFLNSSGDEELFKNYFSLGMEPSEKNDHVSYYILFDQNYKTTQSWDTCSYIALASFSSIDSFALTSFDYYIVPENTKESEFLSLFSKKDLNEKETSVTANSTFESDYKIYHLDVKKYITDGGTSHE